MRFSWIHVCCWQKGSSLRTNTLITVHILQAFIWSLICEMLCAESRETLRFNEIQYVWNTGVHVVPAWVMAYSVIAHLHVFIMTEALSALRLWVLENIWEGEGKPSVWKSSKDSDWVQMEGGVQQSKSTLYYKQLTNMSLQWVCVHVCDCIAIRGYFIRNLSLTVIKKTLL